MTRRFTTASVLAMFATTIVAGILAGLFFVPIPEENRDLVLQLGSAVVTGWGTAMAFYFGASKGGRDALASLSSRPDPSEPVLPFQPHKPRDEP